MSTARKAYIGAVILLAAVALAASFVIVKADDFQGMTTDSGAGGFANNTISWNIGKSLAPEGTYYLDVTDPTGGTQEWQLSYTESSGSIGLDTSMNGTWETRVRGCYMDDCRIIYDVKVAR